MIDDLIMNSVMKLKTNTWFFERYHGWMQQEELQLLTASEPLSLDMEYQMQESWHQDQDKCTFIILDAESHIKQTHDYTEGMIGDVNLFLNDADDKSAAEVSIMIAEEHSRGRGLGKEALLLMMRYGIEEIQIQKYRASIGCSNETSINMFKKLGFQEISKSEVFKEVTFELEISPDVIEQINTLTANSVRKEIGR